MFDLTKEIKLKPQSTRKYNISRALLYTAFLVMVLFVADRIIFPPATRVFSFANPTSSKNNILLPHVASDQNTLAKNSISANDRFTFYAALSGDFSNASLTFTMDKKSDQKNSIVSLSKSHQSFFYPTGKPAGFKNGTLLTTADGKYYIVSNGKIRKFSNINIVSELGFPKNSFTQISQDDLQYNETGEDIVETDTYPDNTFFAIDDTYYELIDRQLFPFVSTQAFLSQFDFSQAIIKNSDFLARYAVSETPLGFADGTLASLNGSVFILSEGKSYPIADANTFVQMGFEWENIIALENNNNLAIYEKQKLFNGNQPHPDGTLFLDPKIKKYFIVSDGEKLPIESKAVADTYSKQHPVIVDLAASQENVSCQLKKKFLSGKSFVCDFPVKTTIGNYYKIDTMFANDAKIGNIDITFYTTPTWQNFKTSLSKIRNEALIKYNITPPTAQ